jgi:hypothetical protein
MSTIVGSSIVLSSMLPTPWMDGHLQLTMAGVKHGTGFCLPSIDGNHYRHELKTIPV